MNVPVLAGLSCTMRVDVQDDPVGTIHVDHGRVWADETAGEADVVAIVGDKADFARILAGELNPVVAAIQGRIAFRRNPELATRIILALNAARPSAAQRAAGG